MRLELPGSEPTPAGDDPEPAERAVESIGGVLLLRIECLFVDAEARLRDFEQRLR